MPRSLKKKLAEARLVLPSSSSGASDVGSGDAEFLLDISLTAKQREFMSLPHRFVAFFGGYGSGKTTVGCIKAVWTCLLYSGVNGLVARKTEGEIKEALLPVLDWVLSYLPDDFVHWRREDREVLVRALDGGVSRIIWRPLDEPKKLQGLNLGFFYLDEAVEIEEEFWRVLLSRLRQDVGPRKAWVTSIPPPVNHWLYRLFIQHEGVSKDEYGYVQASSYDNPYLPEDYLERLEQVLSEREKRRLIWGEFERALYGVPIFGDFSVETHVISEDEAWSEVRGTAIYRGIDFGYAHPAAVWVGLDEWQRLIVLDEFMGEGMTMGQFVAFLRAKDKEIELKHGKKVVADFCDPHGTYKTDMAQIDRFMYLKREGFNPIPSVCKIEESINRIEKLLTTIVKGKPCLRISERCVKIIQGMLAEWVWDDKGKLDAGETEHILDALRYCVMGLVGRSRVVPFVGIWDESELLEASSLPSALVRYEEDFRTD